MLVTLLLRIAGRLFGYERPVDCGFIDFTELACSFSTTLHIFLMTVGVCTGGVVRLLGVEDAEEETRHATESTRSDGYAHVSHVLDTAIFGLKTMHTRSSL